jgi:hypothetical protein
MFIPPNASTFEWMATASPLASICWEKEREPEDDSRDLREKCPDSDCNNRAHTTN